MQVALALVAGIIVILNFSSLCNGSKLRFDVENESIREHRGVDFFNSLAFLDFGISDITAMLKNAAAEEQTEGCAGMCRTPIAFWMLQSLVQCNQVSKADCPAGLVCCSEIEPSNRANYFRTAGTPFEYQIPEEDLEVLRMLQNNKTTSTMSTLGFTNVQNQNKTSL